MNIESMYFMLKLQLKIRLISQVLKAHFTTLLVAVWSINECCVFSPSELSLLAVSPSEIQASPNANATLPCNVTLPPFEKGDKTDGSLINVSWISNGSDIASFSNAVTKIKEGFGWDTREFVNGDFSLTILRASLGLQGVYECKVSYNSTTLHSSNITFSILGMSLFSC